MITTDKLPIITAHRVTLRWLTDRDVPALYEIFSDPEVMRYWSSPPLPGLDAAASLLAEIKRHFAAGTLYQWGALRDGDKIIGTCTLAAVNVPHRRAELGFAVSRSKWGQGYASEAIAAIIRFAFTTLHLHRLEADVDPRNLRSVRCLEDAGFVREGYARERYHLNGEIQDAVLYGLLARDAGRRL